MSTRAYIRTEDVMADIRPLAMTCSYTLEDLVNATGYDEVQVRRAWARLKEENVSGLAVGVDPEGWVYCITDEPERIQRIYLNRDGDSLTRLMRLKPAIIDAMHAQGMISNRQRRALLMLQDEAIEQSERTGKALSRRTGVAMAQKERVPWLTP